TRTWYDISSVCFINQNVGWVSGDYGAIMTTEDGGGITALKPHADAQIPSGYTLYQNYPNPFNPTTTIRFDLPLTSKVTLKVFNILGEEVVTLTSATLLPGSHSVKWNALNHASGIYLIKLTVNEYFITRKMLLVR
ncbi:MAG: T9SS type A sorting domain-containing protein, partial [bacterium]